MMKCGEGKRDSFRLPTLKLQDGYNTRQAMGYGFRQWRDFFNARQLLALDWLHEAITSLPVDQGRGVPQDAAGAVAWYRRAAEQGNARAQYNLGGMYDQGRGVPQDAAEAHMWLTIAASRSTGAEREQIVTARAAVAARMTPTDLREADRRARAWHAAHQGMRNRAAPHQGMRNRAAPPSATGSEGLIIALGLLVAL